MCIIITINNLENLISLFFRNKEATTKMRNPHNHETIFEVVCLWFFFALANFSITNLWVHKPFSATSSPNSSSHCWLRSGFLFLITYGSGQTPLSSQYAAVRVQTPMKTDKNESWCMPSCNIISIRIFWFTTLSTSLLATAKPCLLWNDVLMSNN